MAQRANLQMEELVHSAAPSKKKGYDEEIAFKLVEFKALSSAAHTKRIMKTTKQEILEKNERIFQQRSYRRRVESPSGLKAAANLELLTKTHNFSKITIITIFSTVFQATMAFLASILYIVNTYYYDDKLMEPTFIFLETLIGFVFLLDYLWNFIHANDKTKFFLKPRNILDLITILPAIINYIPSLTQQVTLFLASFVGIVRVTRIFRVFRVYKLLKENREQNYSLREYWESRRQSFVVISEMFVSLLIAAGLIHAFHAFDFGFQIGKESQLSFDAALYYITVTCSTVGYGDLTPQNELSQVIILIFVVAIIYIIARATNIFNELSKITSKYKLPYQGHQKKHVFLIGNITPDNFITFAKEFYHPDICPDSETPVVLMLPQEPNDEWKSIFQSQPFNTKLFYLVGNPLKKSDLHLAKLTSNKVLILVDQFSTESDKEDTFALLATQVISDLYPRCQIFTQVNKKENASWSHWHGQTSFSSANLLKMGTIAQNAFIPGFSTLITNLSMSLSEGNHLVKDYSPWRLEYIAGMSNEIYIIDFKEDKCQLYIGKPFHQACLAIYNKTGILLIGLKVKNHALSKEIDYFDIVINPINYLISQDDQAIVLAKSIEDCQHMMQSPSNELGAIQEQDEEQQIGYHRIQAQIQTKIFSVQSCGQLDQRYFKMSKTDMREQIFNHILVIGEIGYIETLIEELRSKTDVPVCYVSKSASDEKWDLIAQKYSNVYYFECQYFNIEELERTAIRDSFHLIILSGPEGTDFQDNRILPLASIITENFPGLEFTLELRREKNVKYIISKVLGDSQQQDKTSKTCYLNPFFASAKLYYSASISYSMARNLHMENFCDVLEKLISPHLHPNLSKIHENNHFSFVQVPDSISNIYTYQQVFDFFIKNQILPIALYRKARSLDNEEDFVYTNPNPQAPILKGDKLIVIGNITNQKKEQYYQQQGYTQSKELNNNSPPQMESDQSSEHIEIIDLIPELNVFGEEKDNSDQKGLAKIRVVSKYLIESNRKFAGQSDSILKNICDSPGQLSKLEQLTTELEMLIQQNDQLRTILSKNINSKVQDLNSSFDVINFKKGRN